MKRQKFGTENIERDSRWSSEVCNVGWRVFWCPQVRWIYWTFPDHHRADRTLTTRQQLVHSEASRSTAWVWDDYDDEDYKMNRKETRNTWYLKRQPQLVRQREIRKVADKDFYNWRKSKKNVGEHHHASAASLKIPKALSSVSCSCWVVAFCTRDWDSFKLSQKLNNYVSIPPNNNNALAQQDVCRKAIRGGSSCQFEIFEVDDAKYRAENCEHSEANSRACFKILLKRFSSRWRFRFNPNM